MSYEVKTAVFEGPLDLLLQLITSHRLAVTEVSLSQLVTEYLAHLELMETTDLEVTSEFLVIAATLIQLKARHLLPGNAAIDLDEDLLLAEERDRLLARLLANLTFKDVAAVFAHRLETTDLFLPRFVGLDADVSLPPPDTRIGLGVAEFARLAERILTESIAEPTLDHLELDVPSVTDAIADLRRRLDLEIETDFDRVTRHLDRPIEVIAYFLAMLELARWGLLRVDQDDLGDPIRITRREAASGVAAISEWDQTP